MNILDYFNDGEIKSFCDGVSRIPISIRTNKDLCVSFLYFIKDKKFEVKNSAIYALCSWVKFDLNDYRKDEEHSIVESIECQGIDDTYDMHIKNGNSYTANGIVCHNTINLPNNVSVEEVKEIYELAWKEGLKGVTIYRDGCRTGVLLDSNKDEEKKKKNKAIQKTHAVKRPENLKCDIHHIKISKRLDKVRSFEYLVIIGLMEDEPYEIFAIENGFIDKKYTTGITRKKKSGHYSLIVEENGTEKVLIDNISKDTSESEDALTRMTSTALRHGADITFVFDQLEKAEGDMFGFCKAISRTLKKYIKSNLIKQTRVAGESCPQCKSTNLIKSEGCMKCAECGWSKCG